MGHGPLTTLRGAKFFELVCRLNYLLTQQIRQEDFQERDFVILMGPGSIIAYPIMIMMLLNNNNVIHRPNLALKRLCFFSCFVHSCRKFDIVVMFGLYPEKVHFCFLPATGSPKAQDSETPVFWSFTWIMCTFAYLNIKYYCQTFKMKERNARYGFEPSQN